MKRTAILTFSALVNAARTGSLSPRPLQGATPCRQGAAHPASWRTLSFRGCRLLALFGRDRRVGECLLLREERKSGLRGPISVFDPGCVKTRTSLSSPELFSQLPASDGSCQCNLISTATKSRWKFYTKVRHRSFHTALYEDFRVKCYCNSMSFVVRGSV